jgi:hypothetical protein
MKSYVHILYRAAHFWSWAPPDTAMLLMAFLERPAMLVAAAAWAWGVLSGNIYGALMLYFLGHLVWPWLPLRVRRLLLRLRGYFAPPTEALAEAPAGAERITELEATVREQGKRLDHLENHFSVEPGSCSKKAPDG